MPIGQVELVGTFDIDDSGLLKVTAEDRSTGHQASISESIVKLVAFNT
jgi:molecular chaperone DnaK (HSP70)